MIKSNTEETHFLLYVIMNIKHLILISVSVLSSLVMGEEAMIYAKKEYSVGKETVVESKSPKNTFMVVFEDDTETGYFYGLDTERNGNPILDALQIYNVSNVTDKDILSKIQIIWSGDGKKAMLLINDYPHAVFDFGARRGYCRTNFPPPDKKWTNHGHEWSDASLELF